MAIAPSMLFLLLVAAVILVVIIVLWPRGRRTDQPVCGRCSYAVAGLESLTCPECGSDLRDVGIFTPAMRNTVGPVARMLLWTVLIPLPAIVSTQMIVAAVPMRVISTTSHALRVPASRAFSGVDLTVTSSGLGTPRPDTIDLVVIDDAGNRSPQLSLDATAATDESPPINSIEASQLFANAGIEVTEEVSKDITELVDIVNAAAGSPAGLQISRFSFTSMQSRNSAQPITWVQPALIGGWIAIYCIGLAIMFFSGRRAMAPRGTQAQSIAT